MLRCKKYLLVLFGLSAGIASAQVYDLSKLEAMALESSRALQASRDQVTAARHAADAAAAYPNPEVEYLTGTARSRAPGGTVGDASSASVLQPLDLPWRRSARIDVARAGLASVEAEARVFQTDLLSRLRLRYFDMLRRDAELRNALEDQQLMEKVRSRIALRVETGEAPRFELIKADAEALNAAKVAQAASIRLEQARSQLRQIVGVPLPAGFSLAGKLGDVPAVTADADIRRLRQDNPELTRARTEVVRAERQLAYERAQRWPTVALKGGVDTDPDMRTSKIGVVVSVPLWDRRSAQVDEAAALLAKARNEYDAQEFTLGQSLEVAYQQYEIAAAQATALESGIVRQAEAALKVAEAAYRFGERGFLEVLDAQRVYRAARAELIAARYELAAAWVEIERLRATTAEGK